MELQDVRTHLNVPNDLFKTMVNSSYFLGLQNKSFESNVDYNDRKIPIEISVDTIENQKSKVQKIFRDILMKDQETSIRFICEDPFTYVFFVGTFFDFNEKGLPNFYSRILPNPICIGTTNAIIDREDKYEEIKGRILDKTFENIQKDEESDKSESELLFKKLILVMESLFLKDFFDYNIKDMMEG